MRCGGNWVVSANNALVLGAALTSVFCTEAERRALAAEEWWIENVSAPLNGVEPSQGLLARYLGTDREINNPQNGNSRLIGGVMAGTLTPWPGRFEETVGGNLLNDGISQEEARAAAIGELREDINRRLLRVMGDVQNSRGNNEAMIRAAARELGMDDAQIRALIGELSPTARNGLRGVDMNGRTSANVLMRALEGSRVFSRATNGFAQGVFGRAVDHLGNLSRAGHVSNRFAAPGNLAARLSQEFAARPPELSMGLRTTALARLGRVTALSDVSPQLVLLVVAGVAMVVGGAILIGVLVEENNENNECEGENQPPSCLANGVETVGSILAEPAGQGSSE